MENPEDTVGTPPASPSEGFLRQLVVARKSGVFASSRDVAKRFGKQHKHVLRDIDRLMTEAPECRSKFGLASAAVKMPNGGTRKERYFNMTQDGFSLLVMGFSGETATQWKLLYIQAFNLMRRLLQERASPQYKLARGKSKEIRNGYTQKLSDHGCNKGWMIAGVTNAGYEGIWNKGAPGIRKDLDLPPGANVKEHLSLVGLTAVMLQEAMTSAEIEESNIHGYNGCERTAYDCGRHVRKAIISQRDARKKIKAA